MEESKTLPLGAIWDYYCLTNNVPVGGSWLDAPNRMHYRWQPELKGIEAQRGDGVFDVLLLGGSGMAFGGWFAGYLFDLMGFYAAAFAAGLAFNVVNTAILAFLVYRQMRYRARPEVVAAA